MFTGDVLEIRLIKIYKFFGKRYLCWVFHARILVLCHHFRMHENTFY